MSFLPDGARADYGDWSAYLNAAGKLRSAREAPGAARAGQRIRESEAPDESGGNDTRATADDLARFGTAPGRRPAAIITGDAPAPTDPTQSPVEQREEDGAIGVANPTGLVMGTEVVSAGVIGDGAWGFAGAGTGDFDFFAIQGASAGQEVIVDIDTPAPFSGLDSFVAVFDSAGVLVGANDDDGQSFDSRAVVSLPAAGDYFVSIGGFGSFFPEDPFTVGSPGVGGGAASEGSYDVTISLVQGDLDVFAFDGRAGDIVGAAAIGAGRLSLLDADGLLIGSEQNITFIHPPVSPLPSNGDVALSYVLPDDGRYYLVVDAGASYEVEFRAFRPAKERRGQGSQVLYLDFDGATIDPSIFFGGSSAGSGELSPLRDFLPRWGLTAADEDAVIDSIVAAVEETLSGDPRANGNNGDRDAGDGPHAFDVEIRNSRDHADPWGQPFVSRIVVGGTVQELGIFTIGIAQSIDVGDFESEESAVVLLDLLSDPSPFGPSLNNVPRAPTASIVDLIGVGVGNIVSHEAGHFFANWHTDQFNDNESIMDQGGNLEGTIGVGDDGIFGTVDDVDVDLNEDIYVPNEGFSGTEDTLNSVAFGLSTGRGRGRR